MGFMTGASMPPRSLLRSTLLALLAPRRLVPILLVATPMVMAQVRFSIDVRGATHVVDLRCTVVVERRGGTGSGRWLLTHFHFSLPNGQQGEGDALMDALGRRNRELEEEVARRTAELERALADLRQAQARLVHQETMASLGRLTAGIAHEIKNPLNFVNNFAGLSAELVRELREELEASRGEPVEVVLPVLAPLLDDLAMNAEKVRAHGRRADAIVQEMMLHARGAHEPRQPVDPNALVAEHAGLAVGGGEEKNDDGGVAVTQAYDPAVGAVVCTPQALGRVLVNLVTNALDAVAARRALAGGEAPYAPAVAVSTHRVDGRVLIAVADNGVGIPEAAQRRLFEPFYTTKPPGRGNVGLGLSLSRDVVHGQGGTLEAESREGEGTTFTVTLPAGAA